jgi:hypothetical protein
MIIRSFFDKNNTLIVNSDINTGRNPVSDLFYGTDNLGNIVYSRFIFQVDTKRINQFINDGTFGDINNIKHTLKLINSGLFNYSLKDKTNYRGQIRAGSFDLILFKINENWDEGNGYDFPVNFGHNVIQPSPHKGLDPRPSNWCTASGITQWNTPGIYSYSGDSYYTHNICWVEYPSGYTYNPPEILETIHFEHGNENLEVDITDYVNEKLTGGTSGDTSYVNLGIAFTPELEQSNPGEERYVGFFTRHTQTIYEPFIESRYLDPIRDDRANVVLDNKSRLYLYVSIGGKLTDLDIMPTVSIIDSADEVIFSGLTVMHASRGVYYTEVEFNEIDGYEKDYMFYDVWSNIQINGVSKKDIELSFVLKDTTCHFNISDTELDTYNSYVLSVHGIKKEERILRGDIRKVIVKARLPYTTNQQLPIDNLQYRLYVKEGETELTIIDYDDVERAAFTNFFFIDTASLIPTTYYVDIKLVNGTEVITYKDIMNFDIISQVELR